MKAKSKYLKDVAFINRQRELSYLGKYINERPESILFIHGPKSSGKTTLLYKFFERVGKEQKLDVKFLNLRENWIGNYKDFIRIFFGVADTAPKKDVKETREYGIFNFFKLSVEVLKRMDKGELDPFQIMKREFIKLTDKGIKPVIIIDELQAIDHIYMNNGKDRQLIIELFNFFVAMTKESHLAHVIIASSDGYFLNTVYNDSRLKKTSKFFKVDYFSREDVMEWLLDVEKHSRITDYKLDEEDAQKIWDAVGGSAWEIQDILSERFSAGLDEVLGQYKKKVQAMVAHYCEFDSRKRKILQVVARRRNARAGDFEATGIEGAQLKELLRDMVRNNILYFDPMDATYSPQGNSYYHGITMYIEDR